MLFSRIMDPTLKNKAVQTIGLGFGVQFLGWLGAAFFPIEAIRRGFPLMISFGLIIIIVGCMFLAEAKRQPKYFGLLGILSLLGVAILWFVVPTKTTA
jgi:fucose permease